ncbi:hypothetical protein [Flavonifractor sp. An306]|uniref:hypothetical protein n=1 Tax=Flavonifractor sp. An306 TaxID=1965629 RepID=UPI0013A66B5B|nr:hypothetical protein [Flavonifractor sp. An306]
MENIWAFLLQTLTASVAAAVLLLAKRLFLDKLSPRCSTGCGPFWPSGCCCRRGSGAGRPCPA